MKQNVQVEFDFDNRKIIQHVQCENPVRGIDDKSAFSAIDLINRKITWLYALNSTINCRITKLGLKFLNDFEYEGFHRYINFPNNSTSVKITAADIGLGHLFQENKKPITQHVKGKI